MTNNIEGIHAYVVLLPFKDTVFFTNGSSLTTLCGASLPTAFADFRSQCHILVTLVILQTLHQQKGDDSLKVQMMSGVSEH